MKDSLALGVLRFVQPPDPTGISSKLLDDIFVAASADLTRCAGFGLTSVRPMNVLVSSRSALTL